MCANKQTSYNTKHLISVKLYVCKNGLVSPKLYKNAQEVFIDCFNDSLLSLVCKKSTQAFLFKDWNPSGPIANVY